MPATLTFEATSVRGTNIQIKIVQPTSECPRCHHGVDPIHRAAHFEGTFPLKEPPNVQVVYQCPRVVCAEFFFAWFSYVPGRVAFTSTPIRRIAPRTETYSR